MMATQSSRRAVVDQRTGLLLLLAWLGTLLASALPEILWREGFGRDGGPVQWLQLGGLLLLLLLTALWREATPLRGYFLVLSALFLVAGILVPGVSRSDRWLSWFGQGEAGWFRSSLGLHLLRMLPALAIWALLAGMGRKRQDYFLVKGCVDAPVEPVPWMGLRRPEPWTRFGRHLALIASGVTLLMMLLGRLPTGSEVLGVLPRLPAVLLFAAMNAFNEEFPGRAALLSQLLGVVEKQQSLLLTAALFGLGHFYGVPPGLSGVFLAGFFGWLLGKSMVETGGFLWAWTIHFLQDGIIFAFLAMAAGG